MTADPDTLVGQSVVLPGYEVSRGAIREFAAAIGETSPLCHDVDAARAAGYVDLVAPPTFAFVPASRALAQMTDLLHAPLRNQLHGEQGFTHHRPITAGDVLTTTAMLTKVRSSGGRMIVGIDYEITDEAGGPVTTARSTIVVSGVGQ